MPSTWCIVSKPLPVLESCSADDLALFAQVRLIALDLDGTLFASGSVEVQDRIRHLCRSLLHGRRSVSVTLTTGRAFAGVRRIVYDLGLGGDVPLVLYNGSVILRGDTSEVIRKQTIDSAAVALAILEVRNRHLPTFAYVIRATPESLWTSERLIDEHVYYVGDDHVVGAVDFNGMLVVSAGDQVITDVVAMLVDVSSVALNDIRDFEAAIASPGLSITGSGSKYLEIRPTGVHKATALADVARALSITRDQVIAIGDNDNDREMLAWAGIGVSVANSSAAAVAASRFYCRYGTGHGAVELLRLVKYARRFTSGFKQVVTSR